MTKKAEKSAANQSPLGYAEAIRQVSAGEIKPVYLLYGEEEFLQELFIEKLREDWLGDGAGVSREDGRAMAQSQAVDLARQILLFSPRRLTLIDEPAFIPCKKEQGRAKPEAEAEEEAGGDFGVEAADIARDELMQPAGSRAGRKEEQPLLNYMIQPAPDSCLLLRCRKGKPDRRNKLVAAIAGIDGLVETTFLEPRGRIPFLLEALRKAGKECPGRVLEQIARQPGGLAFCLRELDKAIAYAGEEAAITADMADAVLTPSLEANIFRMVDALGRRRRADALGELRILLESGESPFGIFAMMLRQFRLLFKAKACLQDGLGRGQIAQALGVQPFVADKSAEQSKYYSYSELERAMALFYDKDLAMKSGAAHGQVLEDLIIALGG